MASSCLLCRDSVGSRDRPIEVVSERIQSWPYNLEEIFQTLAPESGILLFRHLLHQLPEGCGSIDAFSKIPESELESATKDLHYPDEYLVIAVTIRAAIIKLLDDPWQERHPQPSKRRR